MSSKMNILITGTAGFIGFHLVKKILDQTDNNVIGIDIVNDYYDVALKYARLEASGIKRGDIKKSKDKLYDVQSTTYKKYRFLQLDITNLKLLEKLFERESITHVVHLAAQAGVRYSIQNPHAYIQSNIVGFTNILECCRHQNVTHLVYASSSSVYGANIKVPFSEEDVTDTPVSLYAATKKSNELMAYTYSHLYGLPTIGLRFFTVYGPWGRPDMAPMLFANAIKNNKPIKVFNNGDMQRDFTYIDDIVEGVFRCIDVIPKNSSKAAVFNIGNSSPIDLMEFISIMEENMDAVAEKEFLPMQSGDVKNTWADTHKLQEYISYKPNTDLRTGVKNFVQWFKEYKNHN